jgi:hypothetical protein
MVKASALDLPGMCLTSSQHGRNNILYVMLLVKASSVTQHVSEESLQTMDSYH